MASRHHRIRKQAIANLAHGRITLLPEVEETAYDLSAFKKIETSEGTAVGEVEGTNEGRDTHSLTAVPSEVLTPPVEKTKKVRCYTYKNDRYYCKLCERSFKSKRSVLSHRIHCKKQKFHV